MESNGLVWLGCVALLSLEEDLGMDGWVQDEWSIMI